jgi:hypothetical protein
MMTGNYLSPGKKLILCLLIVGFSTSAVFSQKKLSGNLGQPSASVETIPANDRVTVDNVAGFNPQDTILIIQMQGVGILTGLADYGNIQNFLGQPGMHEFMIIQSINILTREIVFRNIFLQTYDTRGNVQIVRVPYYNNAEVTGKLTCDPWDGKKGGVLALILGRSIKLTADIDVSGFGLRGGIDDVGDARCQLLAPVTSALSYPQSFTNAGNKGEGIAIHNDAGVLLSPLNVKGKGPNFTGGGGGNGRFSGGGGGSNRGAGGVGGYEDNVCVEQEGGLGGIESELASFPSLINRIYLGGGGGASTSFTGLSQPGGNGGGIVILVTDSIIGNGGKIISDGGDGGSAVINGGAGGGGGGGSIALSVNSYGSTPLVFSVRGGKGGDNPNTYGEGGGGGGGLVFVHSNTTGNVTNILDGGFAGNYPSFSSASPGFVGIKTVNFKAFLNGFLFNSIRSSITGNQKDAVCSNKVPPKITGTLPVGGTPSYTYLWEKSYDQVTWIPLTNDADPVNYTPALPELVTVWYRRTITDQSLPTPLVDISKPVEIVVQPAITGNIIGKDTTICQGQNPDIIGSVPLIAAPSNGNGIYRYKWLQNSTDPGTWDTLLVATGALSTAKNFDPPVLVQDTYYKRYVQSGRCVDFSNSVKILVLPLITGNIITRSDSIICQGSTFVNLGASAPGGGNNIYIYQWQDSTASSPWTSASGSNLASTYTPDTLNFTIAVQNRFYRRIVQSGLHNVCSHKSLPIRLTKYPKLRTNQIIANLSDSVICSGSTPLPISGTAPTNGAGAGSYTYIWQQSTNGSLYTPAAGVNNASSGNYQPVVLTDTTWLRRVVNSGVYKSAVVCTNTSLPVKINVHKPILNNNIRVLSDGIAQTLCNNQVPVQIPVPLQGDPAVGGNGIFSYIWKISADNSVFTTVSGPNSFPDYAPPALTATSYYKREVTSGACVNLSATTITVTVLPEIANNILSGDVKVCKDLAPGLITGASLSGGDGAYKYLWQQSTDGGGSWIAATGTNNTSNYQPPALSNPLKYRRTVISGLNDCCTNTSDVFDISIDPLPVSPVDAGRDTSIFSAASIYHLNAINPDLVGETGIWTTLDNGTGTFDDATRYNTIVRKLSEGNNSFLWTVTRGPCSLTASVNVFVEGEYFIPQGFSPNGDTWNNTFVIEGLNKEDNWVDLSIVNGAGTEVFSTSNRDGQIWKDWDGKNSKGLDLSEGTYYYMLKLTPKSSSSLPTQSGFIILKRY